MLYSIVLRASACAFQFLAAQSVCVYNSFFAYIIIILNIHYIPHTSPLLLQAGATQAEVERAATAASAHEFISTLPDGYDSQVSVYGVIRFRIAVEVTGGS